MTTHQTATSADRQWPDKITANSDNPDVKENIFESSDPEKIAQSLKKAADENQNIKSSPFRVAMSRLTFYINMKSANVAASQKEVLAQAQEKLREAYGHPPKSGQ